MKWLTSSADTLSTSGITVNIGSDPSNPTFDASPSQAQQQALIDQHGDYQLFSYVFRAAGNDQVNVLGFAQQQFFNIDTVSVTQTITPSA